MTRILLLGADRKRAGGVRSILSEGGYRVRQCRSVARWSEYEREVRPDLVVAAVDSIAPVIAAGRATGRGFRTPVLWVRIGDSSCVPARSPCIGARPIMLNYDNQLLSYAKFAGD